MGNSEEYLRTCNFSTQSTAGKPGMFLTGHDRDDAEPTEQVHATNAAQDPACGALPCFAQDAAGSRDCSYCREVHLRLGELRDAGFHMQERAKFCNLDLALPSLPPSLPRSLHPAGRLRFFLPAAPPSMPWPASVFAERVRALST